MKENNLVEGTKVLVNLDLHFHRGKITTNSLPPNKYGFMKDKDRGNKPHFFDREAILKAAVSLINIYHILSHLFVMDSLLKLKRLMLHL